MNQAAFYKILIVISLTAIIIAGGVMLVQGRPWASEPLEITLAAPAPASQAAMEACVGGEVASPGLYPIDGGMGRQVRLEEAVAATQREYPAARTYP